MLFNPRFNFRFAFFLAVCAFGLTFTVESPNSPDSSMRLRTPGVSDCNQNGIEDSIDIARGVCLDANWNGIPDEYEGG